MLTTIQQWGWWLQGYRIWRADSAQSASVAFAMWQAVSGEAGVYIGSQTAVSGSAPVTGAWNEVDLATPINLSSGIVYVPQYGLAGNFPNTNNYFGSGDPASGGVTSAPIFAYSSASGSAPDPFTDTQMGVSIASDDPTSVYAVTASNDFNGWIDMVLTNVAPAGATFRGFPNMPRVVNGSNQAGSYTLGLQFSVSEACTVSKVWHYSPSGASALPSWCGIWAVSGESIYAQQASPSWSGAAGSGWVYCTNFPATSLAASTQYKVSTFGDPGATWFTVITGYFTSGGAAASGIVNGPLTIPATGSASPSQGSANSGATLAYPGTDLPSAENDWIDIEVQPQSAAASSTGLIAGVADDEMNWSKLRFLGVV